MEQPLSTGNTAGGGEDPNIEQTIMTDVEQAKDDDGGNGGDDDGILMTKMDSITSKEMEHLEETTFEKIMQLFGQPAARYQQLITDEKVLKKSLMAIRFGVFATASNSTILQPNYPIMVTPNGDPDSFPSTSPFAFSAATYALSMFALLGIAAAGLFMGPLSDKYGRKPLLVGSMFGPCVGSILKYFLRKSFWGFSIASFINGIMSGSLPVALAYVGDIYPNPDEKAQEFGVCMGLFLVGQSVGGICAILMASTGLFLALWIGSVMMFAAGITMVVLCIEPRRLAIPGMDGKVDANDDDSVDGVDEPTEINQLAMWNIIIGAFLDNVGSCGLFPLCLSPLMYQKFYQSFIDKNEDPVLTQNGYKWLSIMVAMVVVPTTAVTPMVFKKVGAAGACVFGNVMTAIVTAILLLIGTLPEASVGSMAGFVVVMYLGFPFTVFSQLSTSPMLDVVSPRSKRGYVQGLNSTVMNVGTAFAPWVLGILADSIGTTAAICIGIGISVLAAIANAPLMWRKGMGPAPPPKPPKYARALKGEDQDLVEKALRGSWIEPDLFTAINRDREIKGRPYLVVHPKKFEEECDSLDKIKSEAVNQFNYQLREIDAILKEVATPDEQREVPLADALAVANKAFISDEEETAAIHKELGEWFAAYLTSSGYQAHTNPILVKQMIMSAFPEITKDKELTTENIEGVLLNYRKVFAKHANLQEDRRYSFATILGTGTKTVRYT